MAAIMELDEQCAPKTVQTQPKNLSANLVPTTRAWQAQHLLQDLQSRAAGSEERQQHEIKTAAGLLSLTLHQAARKRKSGCAREH